MKKQLVIEPSWCKGCGICAAFCPRQSLKIVDEKVQSKDDGSCVACGLCELWCPDYALHVEEVSENG